MLDCLGEDSSDEQVRSFMLQFMIPEVVPAIAASQSHDFAWIDGTREHKVFSMDRITQLTAAARPLLFHLLGYLAVTPLTARNVSAPARLLVS